MGQAEFELDIFKLIRTLLSKILVIILAAVLVGALAFGYTYMFMTPTYQATVSLYVNNSSINIGSIKYSVTASELNTSSALVNTYIYILRSRTTLEDVAAKAGVRYSAGALRGMLSITPIENTSVFNVTVTSHSPTEAELIANTIATVLPERITEIVDGSSVRIVDYAIVPSGRSGPNYTTNMLIGFAVGAALAIVIIALKFLIDEQNDVMVHSADELREMFPDISVLALIPDMRLSEKKGYYYSSYYGDSKSGKGA